MNFLSSSFRSASSPSVFRAAYGGLKCTVPPRFSSPGYLGELGGDSISHFRPTSGETTKHILQHSGNPGSGLCLLAAKENAKVPYSLTVQSFIHSSGQKELQTDRNLRHQDHVREVLEQDSQHSQSTTDQNADFVHMKIMRNNTFINVTDSHGNTKIWACSGMVDELKGGGAKMSRYVTEATAEHIGRKARELGLKSVVVKVNGFIHFRKKKQAIMSFREGFAGSSNDLNPIISIEDTTRHAHNGCRLPRKRRI